MRSFHDLTLSTQRIVQNQQLPAPIRNTPHHYNQHMTTQHDFDAFLDLCERMAQRLFDEGKWPFDNPPDSTLSCDLVESNDNLK